MVVGLTLSVSNGHGTRYGIWFTAAAGMTTRNVTIADNYVYMNGRVGVIWSSDDGLGDVGRSVTRGHGARVGGSGDASAGGAVGGAKGGGAAALGTGVAVVRNHVETLVGSTCWSVDGVHMTGGSSTNENRG
jgi:hypothetical protein